MSNNTASVTERNPAVLGLGEMERHPDLIGWVNAIHFDGFSIHRWQELLNAVNIALVTERNESYVHGMHDEHNEPLGDRLPLLPAPR